MDVLAHLGPHIAARPRLAIAALRVLARAYGCTLVVDPQHVEVHRDSRTVVLRRANLPYARDVIEHFDFYWNAVSSGDRRGAVDFSRQAEHLLVGFDLFPVLLPGLPEPMDTVRQYLRLTGMRQGMCVLDLGAYAGVTSMVFDEVVGARGRVVAVEADPGNLRCLRANLGRYRQLRGSQPDIVEAAVWDSAGQVEFAAEGNLGSAVAAVSPRPASTRVRSTTLSDIAQECGLDHVDVIKADVEGAEYRAFSDGRFFEHHHPTIVFEPASTTRPETRLSHLVPELEGYGYRVTVHEQLGSRLPLVLAQ